MNRLCLLLHLVVSTWAYGQCDMPTLVLNNILATCTSEVADNNGMVTINSATNVSHYAVSTANAASYDGAVTIPNATVLNSTFPIVIIDDIPNVGANYIIRAFNIVDDCYTDFNITTSTLNCPVNENCGLSMLGVDVPTCTNTTTCIGGLSFEDANCDGIYDDEMPIGGVEIQVYDCNNTFLSSQISDADGDWQLCGLNAGEQYKVVFTLPETLACWASFSQASVNNNSNVQFVMAGDCSYLGIVDTENFMQYAPSPTADIIQYQSTTSSTSATLAFDGTDSYAVAPNVPLFDFGDSQNFTIEIRLKSSNWNGDPGFISDKDWASGANPGFIIYGGNNSPYWGVNISDGSSRVDLEGGVYPRWRLAFIEC